METVIAYMNKLNWHLEKIVAFQESISDVEIIRDGLIEILISLGYAPDDV